MEEAGYGNLEAHKNQHQKFVNKLLRMRDRCYMGKKEISVELSSFLSGWMIGHILRSNKDYSEVVKKSNWFKEHGKSA